MRFEFPFNMIGVDGRIFNRPVMRVIKSRYTYGAQNKDFGAVLQTGRTALKVPSSPDHWPHIVSVSKSRWPLLHVSDNTGAYDKDNNID